MIKKFGLYFGFLSEPLRLQLKAQGLKYNNKLIKSFEELSKQLLTVHLAGLITDKEKNKALDKLHKRVVTHINQKNK